MDSILITSTLLKLAIAATAVEAALIYLRRLDRRQRIDFTAHVWDKLREHPMALAIYFGARFIGVAILVGLVIS